MNNFETTQIHAYPRTYKSMRQLTREKTERKGSRPTHTHKNHKKGYQQKSRKFRDQKQTFSIFFYFLFEKVKATKIDKAVNKTVTLLK